MMMGLQKLPSSCAMARRRRWSAAIVLHGANSVSMGDITWEELRQQPIYIPLPCTELFSVCSWCSSCDKVNRILLFLLSVDVRRLFCRRCQCRWWWWWTRICQTNKKWQSLQYFVLFVCRRHDVYQLSPPSSSIITRRTRRSRRSRRSIWITLYYLV